MAFFPRIIFVCVFTVAAVVYSFAQGFKPVTTFSDINSPVTCLALSADESLLIAGDSAGAVTFRNAETGKIISVEKAFHAPVENLCFNSTGRLIIAHTKDGEVKIYDVVQKKFIQSLYSPNYSDMHFALFSIADGFIYFNGQGRLYKTRSDLSQEPIKLFEFDSTLTDAVITEDRSALIFTYNNVLNVLNTRTDNITQELITSPSKIERIAISTDNRIVTWSSDGTIAMRKFELNQLDQQPLLWFKAGTPGRFAFSHDGNRMVTGNVGNWARLWKPFEKTVSQELFGHTDYVNNFLFSADDNTLFTSSNDKTIKLWKQKMEEQKKTAQVRKPSVEKVPVVVSPPDSTSRLPVAQADSSMPVIKLDEQNIPVHIGGRKIRNTTTIEIDQPEVDIFVFDNASFDGDIMSLSFRNEWILKHYEVTKKKYKISLHLKPGSNNFLVLFADNLGKTPPNTAAISFRQDKRERIFRLVSDLESCSAINFIYQPAK